MNVKKIYRTIAIAVGLAAMLLSAPSCKKNDDTTSKKYLSGATDFGDYPVYVTVGETVTLHVKGVSHPDGKALGLSYKVQGLMSKADTLYNPKTNPMPTPMDAKLTYTFPDSVATYTFNVTILPVDSDVYYGATGSINITAVHPVKSIPEIEVNLEKPYLRDNRDGSLYNYVTIGDVDWMSRNLHYEGCGVPYFRSSAVNSLFGRFYTWDEAVSVCPEGWRLPTAAEWEALPTDVGKLMVDAHFNGQKVWEYWPAIKITNETGLALMPLGYFNPFTKEDFNGILQYGCFWTADTRADEPGQAIYKYIYLKENDLKTASADKGGLAMSVRCVRKHQ